MKETHEGSGERLDSVSTSSQRTSLTRDGAWFVLFVSGVVVLAAMSQYHHIGPLVTATGCRSIPQGFICQSVFHSQSFFGVGLGSSTFGVFGNAGPDATTYWVISIFIGLCAIVVHYWRASSVGSRKRFGWPVVTVGLGVVVLAIVSRNWFSQIPSDFTIRGMQALLLITIGLIVLAFLDRRWTFSLFVAGFLGLALLSCLYDVVNLFERLHIGGRWSAQYQLVPNLILPGVYLILGSAYFWRVSHRSHLST